MDAPGPRWLCLAHLAIVHIWCVRFCARFVPDACQMRARTRWHLLSRAGMSWRHFGSSTALLPLGRWSGKVPKSLFQGGGTGSNPVGGASQATPSSGSLPLRPTSTVAPWVAPAAGKTTLAEYGRS